MRFCLVLLWLSVGSTTCDGTTLDRTRRLQQQPTFRVTYSADFQHYSNSLCDGAPPVLLVGCNSTSMSILNTSDDSIVCQQTQELTLFPNTATSTVYQCENTCVDSDCENVYRYETDNYNPIDGPFGSIFFSCEGDTFDSIDAAFVFRGGSTEGYCGGTTERQNYHIGRLGVSCPKEDGSSLREYVYDDTFVECLSRGSFTLNLASGNDTDIFACASGMKCGNECFFNFLDFWIEADVPNFYETCVESSVVISRPISNTSYMTNSDLISDKPYSARFEASWGTVDFPSKSLSSCSSIQGYLNVAIICENGATIRFNNSDICAKSFRNEILCSTHENATLIYECDGPQVPASTVTIRESFLACENNTEAIVVRHFVTLGVLCNRLAPTPCFYGRRFFKCYERKNTFAVIRSESGNEDGILVCYESVSLPVGLNQSQVVPSVGVSTRDYWLAAADAYCFEIENATECPVLGTENVFPTPLPTLSTLQSSNETAVGSLIGIALGGAAVGLVLLSAIGFFMLQRKKPSSALLVEAQLIDNAPSVSTTYVVPMASVRPISTSVVRLVPPSVSYKDQARDHANAVGVPVALALARRSAAVAHPIKADPSGIRHDDDHTDDTSS